MEMNFYEAARQHVAGEIMPTFPASYVDDMSESELRLSINMNYKGGAAAFIEAHAKKGVTLIGL